MASIINIDYNEDTGEYYGVTVMPKGQPTKRFMTGDPCVDLHDGRHYARGQSRNVIEGSSVTHFAMDATGYKFDENDNLVKVGI